jgi:hypothetical protein
MRTFLLIVVGLAMLGGGLLVVRWFGTGWRTPFADGGELFIPIWFCVSALNLWIGVKQAGYSIDEELPIFLLHPESSVASRTTINLLTKSIY